LGESEAYFLAEESDCNDAGGIVFEAKDCLEVTGSSFVAGGRYCGGVSKQQKADLIARSKVSQPYASTSETLTSTASSSSSEMVWCASRNAVSWVNKYTCWARYGGKAFPTESEALAEYKRLKAVSTRLLAKKKAEEEAARLLAQKKAEEEAARLLAQKKAEEEAARLLAQKKAEEEAARLLAQKKAEEEAARLLAQKKAEEEAARLLAQKKAEEEAARLLAQKKAEEEAARLLAQKKAEEEAARLLAKKKAEEEAARLLAKKKAEEEAARLLAKKKAEEEAAAQLAQAEPKQDATAMVDKSLELEFWQAIKDSDDPDEYQVYLDEFPTGKFSKLAKLRIKKLGITKVAKSSIPVINYGSYHALVIGNNDYDHLPKLKTAVNDADTVASVLRSDYDFIVKVIKNANRSQMLGSLAAFRKIVSPEDNFLLYYAGHGYLDKEANEGYWLPVDAEPEDPTNWLQNDTIVAQVRAMQAKHVMVVADSCFSGTMTRGLKLEQRTPGWLQKMVKKKARTALTSGGLEPVMDSGGGSHSVFAEAFIRLLEENGEVLDASQLFSQLRPKVMVNSDQTPEYGNIHKAGHGGGDFLFVRQ
jgi:chemotaxis protein histidine kinase CheA